MRIGLALVIFWLSFCGLRLRQEARHTKRAGVHGTVRVSTWDPRDQPRLHEILRLRESEAFRESLGRGIPGDTNFPVFKSALASWAWLEVLQGLHNDASFSGDFSWMFAKLYFLAANTPDQELSMIRVLAPFFLVIGKDKAGAVVLMNELVRRGGKIDWQVWFWYGYYANEVLQSKLFASDLFEHAAQFRDSPPHTILLSLRLKMGNDLFNRPERRAFLEKSLNPELLEKVKLARPGWFEEHAGD